MKNATLWDGLIEVYEPDTDPLRPVEQHKAELRKTFAKLESHRDRLLSHLRRDGRALNEDEAWRGLELTAALYAARDSIVRPVMLASARAKRYANIAKALKDAHTLLSSALNGSEKHELSDYIEWAWWDNFTEDGVSRIESEIDLRNKVQLLADLAATADRASEEAKRGVGAPRYSAVPPLLINGLLYVYERSTGSAPTAALGTRFVCDFLDALGRLRPDRGRDGKRRKPEKAKVTEDTVADAVKASIARRKKLKVS